MEPEGVGYHTVHKILLFKPILSQQQQQQLQQQIGASSSYFFLSSSRVRLWNISDWQLHILFLVPIRTK